MTDISTSCFIKGMCTLVKNQQIFFFCSESVSDNTCLEPQYKILYFGYYRAWSAVNDRRKSLICDQDDRPLFCNESCTQV